NLLQLKSLPKIRVAVVGCLARRPYPVAAFKMSRKMCARFRRAAILQRRQQRFATRLIVRKANEHQADRIVGKQLLPLRLERIVKRRFRIKPDNRVPRSAQYIASFAELNWVRGC